MTQDETELVTLREAARRLGMCAANDPRSAQVAAVSRMRRMVLRAERELGVVVWPRNRGARAPMVTVGQLRAACPALGSQAQPLRDAVLATLEAEVTAIVEARIRDAITAHNNGGNLLLKALQQLAKRVAELELRQR
jgi:hypothetical protein